MKEYDFDQSLKRRTNTTYVTGSYQSDDTIHLLSLPLAQTVYDGNGNQVAQTTNEYDNYASDGNNAALKRTKAGENKSWGQKEQKLGSGLRFAILLPCSLSYFRMPSSPQL